MDKTATALMVGTMDPSVPERACTAFEEVHGLCVTVHDPSGRLWPHLRPDRLFHRHPRCQAVKAQGYEAACVEFDAIRLPRELEHQPDGRLHRCHAGFVEWAVPCRDPGGRLLAVLFAGPGRWTGAEDALAPAWRSTALPPWRDEGDAPVAVDARRGSTVLECLRQLAARLEGWLAQAPAGTSAVPSPAEPLARRRTLILHWIARHHTEPVGLPQLAAHLGLSPSRTGHAVREVCGAGLVELLHQARLETACGLLRQTGLGVAEVAVRSGFGDVAYFHRVFQRRFAATPARWRASGKAL